MFKLFYYVLSFVKSATFAATATPVVVEEMQDGIVLDACCVEAFVGMHLLLIGVDWIGFYWNRLELIGIDWI